MKKPQLSLSSSILIFFLVLLLFFLGCVGFYSLDCSFPLKTSQIEDDAAQRLREASGEAQYTGTYFKSDGELLVYAYSADTAAGTEARYVSYILHPFNRSKARCSGPVISGSPDIITTEHGFWFDYAVEYSGAVGSMEIQKHLHSIFIVLIIASIAFWSRLLYGCFKKRTRK